MRSVTTGPLLPPPIIVRSLARVVMATPQPPLTSPSTSLVRDPHVGEEHLAEVRRRRSSVAAAGPRCPAVHVDEEVGDAPVLRLRRGRCGPAGCPRSLCVRAGRPHLLTVHHPLVAVAHGPGGEPGEVAAGARLAEELAPHLVAAQHRRQVALAAARRCRGR